MDTRLLDILVCPVCKGPLEHDKKTQELICKVDKLAYPIRDGIPIMWADQARDLQTPAAG
ncbi:Trm112 family protein [Herminiimonas fonticola]|uniref:Trm112 family protein n=1 Tax=Herminiimonas fonticola TaxID=303380 RepID=UPI003341B327